MILIIDDDAAVLFRVVHKDLELLAGKRRAGGVIGVAQVDHVHGPVRQRRHKARHCKLVPAHGV